MMHESQEHKEETMAIKSDLESSLNKTREKEVSRDDTTITAGSEAERRRRMGKTIALTATSSNVANLTQMCPLKNADGQKFKGYLQRWACNKIEVIFKPRHKFFSAMRGYPDEDFE